MLYKPDKIVVDAAAYELDASRGILERLAPVEYTVLEEESSNMAQLPISLTRGKRILHLKYFRGSAFKLCPGFSEDVLCCNYWVLDLIENCPLECTYCILQAFLNKPLITFHVNYEEVIRDMIPEVLANPQRPYRIGTGEHSDSLALDHIFRINPFLVETFSRLPNATLELKTKTANIDSLLGLEHGGRTVVSWSLNPVEIIRENEFKTASLDERLAAAATLEKEGYKIAFHFDPLIHYPQWREGYKRTVGLMFEAVSPENVAWISLGTLRYIPALKQIAEERFPGMSIFANEFIAARDGKMRYLKSIRMEMLRKMAAWILDAAPKVPLYLCMEKHSVWDRLMNVHPADAVALERYLNTVAQSSVQGSQDQK